VKPAGGECSALQQCPQGYFCDPQYSGGVFNHLNSFLISHEYSPSLIYFFFLFQWSLLGVDAQPYNSVHKNISAIHNTAVGSAVSILCMYLYSYFNPLTAKVAIMRLLGSALMSHLCDQRRRSKVTGLSDLITLFIDLGSLYCKQTKRAFNVKKNAKLIENRFSRSKVIQISIDWSVGTFHNAWHWERQCVFTAGGSEHLNCEKFTRLLYAHICKLAQPYTSVSINISNSFLF
jgi:hypothetical protein